MCIMSDQEYKKMIHALVVPGNIPNEEKMKRYQPLVDYLKFNTPERLFHFRSCKERSFSEFDKDILGFAPAFKMNDDFDGMLYFDKEHIKETLINAVTQEKINAIIELVKNGTVSTVFKGQIPNDIIQQIYNTFSHLKSKEAKIIAREFIDFATENYNDRMKFISQVTQQQKIACLSRSIESTAMWGYYANNGTGFALSYDLRELNFLEYCLVPVIYSDERFNATAYAEWLLQQQIMQLIFKKSNAFNLYPLFSSFIPCPDLFMSTKILIHKATCWSHEKEWRMVFYENNDNVQNEEHPHILKKPTALYLGRNISVIHEKILCHIAAEKNIPVYKMMICEENQTYGLYPQRYYSKT